MKKFVFIFSFFLVSLFFAFSEASEGFGDGFSSGEFVESDGSSENSLTENFSENQYGLNSTGEISPESESSSEPKISKSLFFTLGSEIMLNTDDSTKSAPSPVKFSLGAGGDFTFKNGILLQAHGSLFTNYYLWDGEKAQPSEVENRTATALSLMIDLAGGYALKAGKSKKHLVSLAAGLGILVRYGILSGDVDESDLNPETGTTASDDVSSINKDFYKNLNFFYPELALSYSYIATETWKVGGEFRLYAPLGSLINESGIDGMIISAAIKLSYK